MEPATSTSPWTWSHPIFVRPHWLAYPGSVAPASTTRVVSSETLATFASPWYAASAPSARSAGTSTTWMRIAAIASVSTPPCAVTTSLCSVAESPDFVWTSSVVVGPVGAGSAGVVVVVVSLAGAVVDVVSLAGVVLDVVSLAGVVVDVVSLAGAVVDVVDVIGSSTAASATCAVDNGTTSASAALAQIFFQLTRRVRRPLRVVAREEGERRTEVPAMMTLPCSSRSELPARTVSTNGSVSPLARPRHSVTELCPPGGRRFPLPLREILRRDHGECKQNLGSHRFAHAECAIRCNDYVLRRGHHSASKPPRRSSAGD